MYFNVKLNIIPTEIKKKYWKSYSGENSRLFFVMLLVIDNRYWYIESTD